MADRLKHNPSEETAQSLTLQSRIASAALLTALLVLTVASALFMLEQVRHDRQVEQVHSRESAALVAALAQPALRHNDPAEAARSISASGAAEQLVRVQIINAAGAQLAAFSPQNPPEGSDQYTTRVEVKDQSRTLGAVLLTSSHHSWTAILPHYIALTGALLFGATGIALLLGRWLARRVVGPIGQLSDLMRSVAASGRFDARAPVGPDDEIGRLTVAFNDLLDRLSENDAALRHSLNELMDARDAAEDANRLKSEFLANISHEIRTPLNGVMAMTEVMQAGNLPAEQRDRLSIVRQSGAALSDVLNDVLDMARIEAGKMVLDSAPFSPAQLARDAVAAFTPQAQAKGLALKLDLSDGASLPRVGDANRLRQILNNLISNALKFTPSGEVLVRLEVEHQGEAPALLLSVTDTGMGLAPETFPQLFQKFVQVDASSTRKFGGIGLGLAICSDLTAMMGGRIWAEEDRTSGACFHVVLPLPVAPGAWTPDPVAQAEPEAPTAKVMAPEDTVETADEGEAQGDDRPIRILAAEDNATNRLVLQALIDIMGFDLQFALNGREAVEAWSQGGFDIVLMDIQMPEMDGVDATRAIRRLEAERGLARTPIIAVSANAMAHQVEEYLGVGMDDHVPKPVELGRLHSAMIDAMVRADAEAERASAGPAASGQVA
jgi:signal transduction histidine kinase/CheY-like chemotaxis protein